MACATTERPVLRIELGTTAVTSVDLPVLGGDAVERLFASARPAPGSDRFVVLESGDWQIGISRLAAGRDLQEPARQLYDELLALAGQRQLARIWNYVPAINAAGPDRLENYQAFCRGRARAFEHAFGTDFKSRVPAASAVGSDGSDLVVVFAATRAAVRHVENPWQIPAYDYPPAYGPRAPSFARATVIAADEGPLAFISGTSAVRGHATVAPGETRAQLACTLENLREISRSCGLGPDLGGANARRSFKIYLRHAADYPAVSDALRNHLLQPGDTVTFLRSDICRADLNLEIEALVSRGERTP